MNNEQILNIVYKTIDEYNNLLPRENHVSKNLDFPVADADSPMDSISMMNFIVMIEEKFAAEGCAIVLLDEENFQKDVNPLASIGSIVELISSQVQQ